MRKEDQGFDEIIEEMLGGLLPSPQYANPSSQHILEGGQKYHASLEAPVICVVDTILMCTIKDGAKEVEIVPTKNRAVVRWEVDGILDERMKLPTYIVAPVVARIKKLGDMNVEECQTPQTGKAHIRMSDKDYKLYIETSPTEWGEKVIINITEIVLQ